MPDDYYYYRKFPHIQPADGTFFITFRLYGSIPNKILKQYREERAIIMKKNLELLSDFDFNFEETVFSKYDHLIDNLKSGQRYLSDPRIADILSNAIHFNDHKTYELICYTIMSTHVHIILYEIKKPLFRILQSLKRYTARESNKILKKEGTFWEKESYDNLIRDRDDLAVKINYVLQNPVKAGLVKNWEDWKYSYCNKDFLD
jgi:putative transposase